MNMFGYTNYYPNYYYPDGDAFTGRTIRVNGQPYFFEKRLGAGGFGAVYSARTANNMPVAVKVTMIAGATRFEKEGRVESFLNEVAQLNRLRQESRHVVVIHNFGFDPRAGHAYIVMELGHENLYTLVKKLREMSRTGSPAIDGEMIKEFWRQMVTIVITLSKNGIVHMDLKPDNLILFGATLKIADLGISRKADALGLAGLGTMGYSAPEIMEDIPGAQRYYTSKADVWSLGAILYFMVYGEPPTYRSGPNPPYRQRPYPDHQLNDMLRRTLVRHPDARADIREVAQHPFTQH